MGNYFFSHYFLSSSCSSPEDERKIGKLAFLTISNVIVIILYTTILWRQNQFQQQIIKRQQNVVTLKQTVAIRIWLTIDYIIVNLLVWALPRDKVLLFEMLKLIVVDNICYRFLGKGSPLLVGGTLGLNISIKSDRGYPSFSASSVTFQYQADLPGAVFSKITRKGEILHYRAKKSSKETDMLNSI